MLSRNQVVWLLLALCAYQIVRAESSDRSIFRGKTNSLNETSIEFLQKLRMQLEKDPLNMEAVASSIGVSLECKNRPFQVTCFGYRQLPGPFDSSDRSIPVFNSTQRYVNDRSQVEHFLNLKGVDSVDIENCITGEHISKVFEFGEWRRGRAASKIPGPHGGDLNLDSLTLEVQARYSIYLTTNLTPNVCSGIIHIIAEEEK